MNSINCIKFNYLAIHYGRGENLKYELLPKQAFFFTFCCFDVIFSAETKSFETQLKHTSNEWNHSA